MHKKITACLWLFASLSYGDSLVEARKWWFSGSLKMPLVSHSIDNGILFHANFRPQLDYFIFDQWSIFIEPYLSIEDTRWVRWGVGLGGRYFMPLSPSIWGFLGLGVAYEMSNWYLRSADAYVFVPLGLLFPIGNAGLILGFPIISKFNNPYGWESLSMVPSLEVVISF